MAETLSAAADALASLLGGLPGVDEAYPYPKMQSQLQPGALVMMPLGASPPGERGGAASSEVGWAVTLTLRSAITGSEIETNRRINELLSLDPDKGILGVIYRNPGEREAQREAGFDFYLDPDGEGITIDYNERNADNEIVDVIRFMVFSMLEDDGR